MACELILTGHVQGVGCRYYCSQIARKLMIHGSATNLRDGSVSLILETDDELLISRYVEALRRNSFSFAFYGSITGIARRNIQTKARGDYEW